MFTGAPRAARLLFAGIVMLGGDAKGIRFYLLNLFIQALDLFAGNFRGPARGTERPEQNSYDGGNKKSEHATTPVGGRTPRNGE